MSTALDSGHPRPEWAGAALIIGFSAIIVFALGAVGVAWVAS